MSPIRAILIVLSLLAVSACGQKSKFRSYDGPEVTRVVVYKAEREMYLLHHDRVLKSYDIGLGFAPQGDKKIEGDGRTPEGEYAIDRRNPNSRYHLSIGVSYPNDQDRAEAKELGKPTGGDIFIHGRGPTYRKGAPDDWTYGCIAVTDREIEDIYAMVRNDTPISIYAQKPVVVAAPPGPLHAGEMVTVVTDPAPAVAQMPEPQFDPATLPVLPELPEAVMTTEPVADQTADAPY